MVPKPPTAVAVLASTMDTAHYELTRRAQAGDADCRGQLVVSNLRLVEYAAKQYALPSARMEDVIQEGNIGLMCAIESFEPSRGLRFGTYAIWWVKASIRRYLDKNFSQVHCSPRTAAQRRKHGQNDVSLDEPIEGYDDFTRLDALDKGMKQLLLERGSTPWLLEQSEAHEHHQALNDGPYRARTVVRDLRTQDGAKSVSHYVELDRRTDKRAVATVTSSRLAQRIASLLNHEYRRRIDPILKTVRIDIQQFRKLLPGETLKAGLHASEHWYRCAFCCGNFSEPEEARAHVCVSI